MSGDELMPVELERVTVGAGCAQGLARANEVGDPADQLLDGRALPNQARRRRWPQRGRHALSVIGLNQEMVKPEKNFSKSLLS